MQIFWSDVNSYLEHPCEVCSGEAKKVPKQCYPIWLYLRQLHFTQLASVMHHVLPCPAGLHVNLVGWLYDAAFGMFFT